MSRAACRLNEPAADLAAAAALLSSFTGRPAPEDTVYFGEVSLTGAIRAVGHMDQRLKEAAKLGFARAVVPAAAGEPDGRPRTCGSCRFPNWTSSWPGSAPAGEELEPHRCPKKALRQSRRAPGCAIAPAGPFVLHRRES